MNYRFLFLVVTIQFVASVTLRGQDGNIETDRPRLTQTPELVGNGRLQVETGVRLTWREGAKADTKNRLSEIGLTQLRFGVNNNFELTVMSGYMAGWIGFFGDTISGMIPVRFGSKIAISEQIGIWPDVAFALGISVPRLGNSLLAPAGHNTDFRFCFSHSIGKSFRFGYNLGGVFERNGLNFRYAASLAWQIIDRFAVYTEILGIGEGTYTYAGQVGVAVRVNHDLQLDLAAGANLNDETLAYVNGGVSVRFGVKHNED